VEEGGQVVEAVGAAGGDAEEEVDLEMVRERVRFALRIGRAGACALPPSPA
jgi:hypothetical protein